MMTKCPKCGFTQPTDKFCANCGVDMELFEPQKSPLYTLFLKSTGLQVFILTALISTMVFIIYSRNTQRGPEKPSLDSSPNRLTVQQQTPTPPSKNPPKIQASPSTVKPLKTQALSNSAQSPIATPSRPPSQQPVPQPNPSPSPLQVIASHSPPKPPPITTLHVRFAEAPQAVINDVVFKNHLITEDSYLRVGSHSLGKRLSKITQTIPGLSFLPGTRSARLPLSNEEPMSFQFLHTGEGEQEYGLQIRLYVQLNSGELVVDLEGAMSFKSLSGEVISSSSPLQGSYTLPQNQVLVIEVVLPTMALDETHMSSFSSTPLSIMSRTDFLEGQTSLVILLQTR